MTLFHDYSIMRLNAAEIVPCVPFVMQKRLTMQMRVIIRSFVEEDTEKQTIDIAAGSVISLICEQWRSNNIVRSTLLSA